MTTDLRATVTDPTPVRTSHRRLDIQGLRAIAVLLVIVFHAQLPVPGGFVGVDVFFVISGFVITAMLMREWAERGRIRFGRFYLRRFLRLTPALAVLVGVVAIASFFLQNPFGGQQTMARTGLGAMLLSANYVIGHAAGDYFAADAKTNPLLNTWSLSVEEQFYLVFPALLVLGWVAARRRASAPVIVVSAIAAASFAVSIAWSYGSPLLAPLTDYFGGAGSFAFYSSFTRAWEFAAGALLVLLAHRIRTTGRGVSIGLGIGGLLLIAAGAMLIHDDQPFPGFAALVPVIGTVLLLQAGSGGRESTGVNRLLATRPMVAIGDISYSWYLWHWPLIVFAALLIPNEPSVLVIAAAVSVVPALLSYRYVEQPLRRLRPRTRPRALSIAGVTVGIPVALCLALLVGAGSGWGAAAPTVAPPVAPLTGPPPSAAPEPAPSVSVAPPANVDGDGEVSEGDGGSLRAQHAVVAAGCVNVPFDAEHCRFGPATATGTVLLAGDSQAYALGDGVIDAAARAGLQTVVTSHTGCPYLARESSGTHNYPCGDWQDDITAWALKAQPSLVVIANRSGGYVRPSKKWRTVATDSGSAAGTADEATSLYRDALDGVVAPLSRAGIPVLIIGAVPEMPGYTIQTSMLSGVLGARAFEIPRADAEADRLPAWTVDQKVATAHPGVTVFDPLPLLCDADVCSTTRDGGPLYQDETHLSLPGSMLLADPLNAAIGASISASTAGSAPQPR